MATMTRKEARIAVLKWALDNRHAKPTAVSIAEGLGNVSSWAVADLLSEKGTGRPHKLLRKLIATEVGVPEDAWENR